MKSNLKLFLLLLLVLNFPVLCQASTIILTNTSPNYTIASGMDECVYGTSASNQITLESGAKATLIHFPGQNNIQIQASSHLFTVSRSGATVTLQGIDGTNLKIPATKEAQTIAFSNQTLTLNVYNGQVMLDDQVIGAGNDSISSSNVPSAATQISPSGIITTCTPTYTWNAVSSASHYYLFPNDSTSSVLFSASDAGCGNGIGTCSITLDTALPNRNYTWYVRSYNSNGDGPLSVGKNFTVLFSPGWSSGAPMPTGRYWSASAVVDDNVYVIGGGNGVGSYRDVEKYNTLTNSWETLQPMPFSDFLLRGATVDGKIYIFGGHINDDKLVYCFDPALENWTRLNDMPSMKWMGEPAVVNNKVYIFGSFVGSNQASNISLEYDPLTDTWTPKAYMPTARYAPATAVYDNKIYVIGGNYGNNKNEVYDPVTNTWQSKSELSFRNSGWGIAGAINGKIYFVDSGTNRMAVYSPETDNWESIDGLSTTRNYLTGEVVNGTLYVFGGENQPNPINLVDIFTPSDIQSTFFQLRSNANLNIEELDISEYYLKQHIFNENAAVDLSH